ncbi:MAG: mechanosensitive ion channel family protein [Bacteroidetes bacterium]|nr:mechanosensitive ion channel family protein [Bacteroidota bacterium]
MWDQFNEAWKNLAEKMEGWFNALVVNLPNILLAVVVLVLSVFASRFVKKGVRRALKKTTNNGTVIGVLSNFVTAIFLVLMLFLILGILNLDKALTSLLAGAGVVGLAVGLALQDPMINLFSGILMSVRDYYKVGDLIETNDYFGRIQKINLRSTVIFSPQGQEVIIPNKEVLQKPLVNYSHNGKRRIDLSCGVSYGDDLEMVKDVALEAIRDNVDYNKSRPLELYFTEFGDSSINFVLRFWKDITAQGDFLSAKDQAIIALKKAFDTNGITIPFPIRTLDFGIVGGERLDEMKIAEEFSLSVSESPKGTNGNSTSQN